MALGMLAHPPAPPERPKGSPVPTSAYQVLHPRIMNCVILRREMLRPVEMLRSTGQPFQGVTLPVACVSSFAVETWVCLG
jgi:hypothetical protein